MSLGNLIKMLSNKGGVRLSDYYIYDGELYHYGVPGMKWGVRKTVYRIKRNERLNKKATDYDVKSYKHYKKSERIHADKDLGSANKAANKAAKYGKKAEKMRLKGNKETDEITKLAYYKKAENYKFKSTKYKAKADTLSRVAGYGLKAERQAYKADKMAVKAEKARNKMATNELYIKRMQTKLRDIPNIDKEKGYMYVQNWRRNA